MSEEVITSIYKTVYTDSVSVVLHLLQVQVANVNSLNFELLFSDICIHNIHIQLNASMCILNNGPVHDNDSLFFFFFFSSPILKLLSL